MAHTEGARRIVRRDAGWSEPPYRGAVDDEISLFDLWAVLVRRKWLVAAIAAVVLGGAVAYAALQTPVYEYSATLQLGRIPDEAGIAQIVESPASVVAKLSEVYIPSAVRSVVEARDLDWVPTVDASAPGGGEIILLTTEGPESRGGILAEIMAGVMGRVASSHDERLSRIRAGLEAEREEARQELAVLREERQRIQADAAALTRRREILGERIDTLGGELAQLRRQRSAFMEGAATRAGAGTALISLNESIAGLRDEIEGLLEIREVGLPSQQTGFNRELVENRASQAEALARVRTAEDGLAAIRPTEVLREPGRGLQSIGPGMSLIVALGVVLGLILGVFGAFFAEFVSRANAHINKGDAAQ